MRQIGAPSLFAQFMLTSPAPSQTDSVSSQPTASSATAQQGRIVPGRVLLNGHIVQVGGYKPLEDPINKALLPHLFRPDGNVEMTHLENGDIQARYKVFAPNEPDSPFEITFRFGRNDQLKTLTAESLSNPERAFPNMEFTPLNAHRPFVFDKSDLQKLPNELLDRIAGHTDSENPNGILGLRQINWHTCAIADRHITPVQRFLINKGQALADAGFSQSGMKELLESPEDQRNFVLRHCQVLKDAGYEPSDTIGLAWRPAVEREFVAAHPRALKKLGCVGSNIRYLAKRPTDERDFVLNHGQKLKDAGHRYFEIFHFATKPEDQRNFIADNAHALKDVNIDTDGMLVLAEKPEDQRTFVVNNAQTLFKAGHDVFGMLELAAREDRDVVLRGLR